MLMCEKCEARQESGEAKSNVAKVSEWMRETGLASRLGNPNNPGGAVLRDVVGPFMATIPSIQVVRDAVIDAYLLGVSVGAYVQAHGMNDVTAIPAVFTNAFIDETPQG